jgi:hypothetical protein
MLDPEVTQTFFKNRGNKAASSTPASSTPAAQSSAAQSSAAQSSAAQSSAAQSSAAQSSAQGNPESVAWWQNLSKLTSLSSSIRATFYILGAFVGATFPLVPTAEQITVGALAVALLLIPLFWEKCLSRIINKINHFLDADIRRRTLWLSMINKIIVTMHDNGISNQKVSAKLTYQNSSSIGLTTLNCRLKITGLQGETEITKEVDLTLDVPSLCMDEKDANQLMPEHGAEFSVFVPMTTEEQQKEREAKSAFIITRFVRFVGLDKTKHQSTDSPAAHAKAGDDNEQQVKQDDISSRWDWSKTINNLSIHLASAKKRCTDIIQAIKERFSMSSEKYAKWIYNLKQFMNVAAISAGFLFIQECLQFWFKSQPLLIMAYTIAAVVAFLGVVFRDSNDHVDADGNEVALDARDKSITKVIFDKCSKFTQTPFFKTKLLPSVVFCACFYALPRISTNLSASWPLISLVLVLIAACALTYKLNYERDLRSVREKCDAESTTYREKKGSILSSPKKKLLQQKVLEISGKTFQGTWEFVRTFFPLIFLLDFIFTKCGAPSIGVLQMSFSTMFNAPLSVLLPELFIASVFCAIFSYSMIQDTVKETGMDEDIEGGITIQATNSSKIFPKGGTIAAFEALFRNACCSSSQDKKGEQGAERSREEEQQQQQAAPE